MMPKRNAGRLILAGAMFALGLGTTTAISPNIYGGGAVTTVTEENAEPAPEAEGTNERRNKVVVRTTEQSDEAAEQIEVARLGVSTEETSEAVAAQLGLPRGAGLLISYVAANSPAAKAGLQKNDVLVGFDGQILVLPSQLRILVQMHKPGESVKVEFYRSGKKQDVTATLDKTKTLARRPLQQFIFNQDHPLHLMQLQHQTTGSVPDKEQLEIEIRRSVENARKSVEEALKEAGQGKKNARMLEEMARRGVLIDKDATVTVKNNGSNVKTMVKSDETATYVIVADPKKRLTVHDKKGKLLFDGEIETAQQRERIPAKILQKVTPMLEEMDSKQNTPEQLEESSHGKSKHSLRLNTRTGYFQSGRWRADALSLFSAIRYLIEADAAEYG